VCGFSLKGQGRMRIVPFSSHLKRAHFISRFKRVCLSFLSSSPIMIGYSVWGNDASSQERSILRVSYLYLLTWTGRWRGCSVGSNPDDRFNSHGCKSDSHWNQGENVDCLAGNFPQESHPIEQFLCQWIGKSQKGVVRNNGKLELDSGLDSAHSSFQQ